MQRQEIMQVKVRANKSIDDMVRLAALVDNMGFSHESEIYVLVNSIIETQIDLIDFFRQLDTAIVKKERGFQTVEGIWF